MIDVGGGTTETALISLGGDRGRSTPCGSGSFDLDAAIQAYVRREYRIAVGERTAEEIKLAIGSAWPTRDEHQGRGPGPRPGDRAWPRP